MNSHGPRQHVDQLRAAVFVLLVAQHLRQEQHREAVAVGVAVVAQRIADEPVRPALADEVIDRAADVLGILALRGRRAFATAWPCRRARSSPSDSGPGPSNARACAGCTPANRVPGRRPSARADSRCRRRGRRTAGNSATRRRQAEPSCVEQMAISSQFDGVLLQLNRHPCVLLIVIGARLVLSPFGLLTLPCDSSRIRLGSPAHPAGAGHSLADAAQAALAPVRAALPGRRWPAAAAAAAGRSSSIESYRVAHLDGHHRGRIRARRECESG